MEPQKVCKCRTPKETEQHLCATCGGKVLPPFKFDTNAVIFMIYLLYKANMVSRHNVAQFFKVVKDPAPSDIIEWLVEESKRAA